ncbi:extracellular solute-binding protein [Dermabacteraceae bacterium TAE3-ERU27]|nr:extracellular solute-binding protein [Dermabacteraceae bacterium TAE3-ERU27]
MSAGFSPSRRSVLAAVAATALTGCTGKKAAEKKRDPLRFRIWDEAFREPYNESLRAFTEKTGIEVELEVMDWGDYWPALPLEVARKTAPDVFWLNAANFLQLQDAGNLREVSDPGNTQQRASDLYRRDGKLWGAVQFWDTTALFYNRNALEEAKIDPDRLRWLPNASSGDTLLAAARALSTDTEGKHPGEEGFAPDKPARYGFNAEANLPGVVVPFVSSAGSEWLRDGKYAFNTPGASQAVQYLADMVHKHRVAPATEGSNGNPAYCRDLFLQGRLALYQSGSYNLQRIAGGVGKSFAWGIAAPVAGPNGPKSFLHAVAAVGYSHSKRGDDTGQLLDWLASADGQRPFAAAGIAMPGNRDVEGEFLRFWEERGVNATPFVKAAGEAVLADRAEQAVAGHNAISPFFERMLAGQISPQDGLRQAQEEGNKALT